MSDKDMVKYGNIPLKDVVDGLVDIHKITSLTCKNCLHWANGHCLNEKLESPDNDGLISYYGERTKTGPDFGCIHFEGKEDE